jgi:hypothetical protein
LRYWDGYSATASKDLHPILMSEKVLNILLILRDEKVRLYKIALGCPKDPEFTQSVVRLILR